MPRRLSQFVALGWVAPTTFLALAMAVRWDDFGAFQTAVLVLSGVAAGFVAGSYVVFLIKKVVQPVREALAQAIPDPQLRDSLTRSMPLGSKLLTCLSGVAVIPVLFAVLLAQAKATGSLEDFAVQWQYGVLDSISERFERGEDLAVLQDLIAESALPVDSQRIALVALSDDTGGGLLGAEGLASLRAQLAAGATRGDGTSLAGSDLLAWRRVDANHVLLASLPRTALRIDVANLWVVLGLLVLISTGVALGLAYLLAGDVSGATLVLRAEAERLASGDLRPGGVFESEDELGSLARSFEGMALSLRATVSRVAEAADRVEATAGEMASVSESVATVTRDQVRGVSQTMVSMEAINGQVQGIAGSSQALNVSVEESSSSILELGAAGEELNETALVLSSKVDEVSSSIGQMVRSVKQVLENTEALSRGLGGDVFERWGRWRASMREVDSSGGGDGAACRERWWRVRSSGQVKMRADDPGNGRDPRRHGDSGGRDSFVLGAGTKEIGAIVDVIDDVADETSLLALNAAIIAAQAGRARARRSAVVADEIKDLADRVLSSTKEIGSSDPRGAGRERARDRRDREGLARAWPSGVDLTAEAGTSSGGDHAGESGVGSRGSRGS